MAAAAHTGIRAGRGGLLAAALIITFILCFLPRGVLAYLNGPRRLIGYISVPISDPVHAIASYFLPAAPKPDDPRVAALQREIETFKLLLNRAQATIEDQRRLIEALQKGAAHVGGAFPQVPAAVTSLTSTGSGGILGLSVGSGKGIDRNTIATTNGVQLVGRIGEVDPSASKVILITDKASGTIDGVITADDGTRLAEIRNMSPRPGKRFLVGQVQHRTPAPPEPKVGDVVRVDDPNWSRSSQRLIVGVVTEVQTVAGGRILVTVKPSVDLERLTEVILLLTPKGDAGGAGGGP